MERGDILKFSDYGLKHLFSNSSMEQREEAKKKRFIFCCHTRGYDECLTVQVLPKKYYGSYHKSFLEKEVNVSKAEGIATFYTTWVEGTNGGYGREIYSFEKAKAEAERLAQLPENIGKNVRVMQCLGIVYCKNTVWEEAIDVPF